MSCAAVERQQERLHRENYYEHLHSLEFSQLEGLLLVWPAPRMWESCFGFSIWCRRPHISTTFSHFSQTNSLSAFLLSCSLCPRPTCPCLKRVCVCFMPSREPICTDVFPGLHFKHLPGGAARSKTTNPDEKLNKFHLATSHSTWGLCP